MSDFRIILLDLETLDQSAFPSARSLSSPRKPHLAKPIAPFAKNPPDGPLASFALGAKVGYRLPKDLMVLVSGDTMLGYIRSMRLLSRATLRVFSVEDFAFRSGSRCGAVWWTRNTAGWWTCWRTLARTASPGAFASTRVWR